MHCAARPRSDRLPLVIVDTNVLVSGTANRSVSSPSRIVDAVLDGTLDVLASTPLLEEYAEVLRRPALRRRVNLGDDEIGDYIDLLTTIATIEEPVAAVERSPDPTDQHLWDLLAAVPAAILVTGDKALLASDHFPGRILSPRQFVERDLA